MKYRHRFLVKSPLKNVREFHARPSSMGAITPPPVIVRLHWAPLTLNEGDQMEFTLWLGPLPIRWLACIEEVTAGGFVDRQIRGPFSRWSHRHRFIPSGDRDTEVSDEVEARLSHHPFWALVGLGMWLSLPLLFAFRGWKTRRILERA
jgi:ligand-binding SRPBCC domain-containing protein